MLRHSSFKRALLAGALFIAGGGIALADYNTGAAAYNAGNYNRAYQEFKQSADAGNSLSQFMMGRLYAEGRGVVTDKVAAYMWFDLSASNGNTRAIAARDAVARELDSDEVDRAQDLAADWRASHQTNASATTASPAAPAGATPTSLPYSLRNVQVALSQLGYSVGTPDGVIGPKSRAAIRAYQVDSGLPSSGEPSLALYERLQASIAKRSAPAEIAQPAKPSVTSTMISQAQTELRRRGYAITAITGAANAETVAAVRDYQADAKLPVTGEIDDALLQQLGTATADSGAIYRAQVKQVQAALNGAGYTAGPPDGALGPKSRAAISRYQSDNGLAATGDVNAELLASLGIESGEQPLPQANAETIREMKQELREHGYVVGNLDTTLDQQTREAIRAYEADAGLRVTGVATPELLDHLRTSSTYARAEDTEVVLDIEDELQRRGYTVGSVDGVVDARTRTAVRTYQIDAGLAVTGEADEALLAHLRSSDVQAMPTSAIAEIQYLLNRLGYLTADSDGIMGPQSTSAIRRYQGDRGLLVNGWPTQDLLAKLRQEPIAEPGAKNY